VSSRKKSKRRKSKVTQGDQGKKHFLEGDSQIDIYKKIRKHPVPSTQIHESKKKKWNWQDELDDFDDFDD